MPPVDRRLMRGRGRSRYDLPTLAHSQQNSRVIHGFKAMSGRRDHEQVPSSAGPGVFPRDEAHPSFDDVKSRLTRIRMFCHHGAGSKSDEGLSKNVLVSTVDSLRARAARRL